VRALITLLAIGMLVAACGTSPEPSSTEPEDPGVPTEAALAANEVFLVEMPAGYADCGATVLTSGYPTTTAFNPDVSLTCLNRAIETGTPSQYAYWGRDGTGGISGAVVRLGEDASFTVIDYRVDSEGKVTSTSQQCDELGPDVMQPPVCAG
jgi:hypothetical protein